MSLLVDCHAHLQNREFDKDRNKVIEKAEKAGVKAVINASTEPKDMQKVLKLAEKHKALKPALGFHPVYVDESSLLKLNNILAYIEENSSKIIAISEIGLDYHHSTKFKKQQTEVFQNMIDLAEKIKKPVIVHSRKAEEDVIKILEKSRLKKVIFHSFDGKKSLVKRIIEIGWYISIPTNVVRSLQLQDIVKLVNINQLLAETDSPYLSPYKEKRNEPAFVIESYKKIAELKGMDLKEVENNLYMNYEKMFL